METDAPQPEVPFRFPVEIGSLADFRDALDGAARRREVLDSATSIDENLLVPPPTYPISSERFRQNSPLRPSIAPQPTSSTRDDGETLLPPLHASQEFNYRRYPRVGEDLIVRVKPGRSWTKPSKFGGHIAFRENIASYFDQQDELVLTSTWTDAQTPVGHRVPVSIPAESKIGSPSQSHPRDDRNANSSAHTELVLPQLTLAHLVRYAAASGDFVAVHHDIDAAIAGGFPGVFAPGMFTLGQVGSLLERLYGRGQVATVSAEFRRPVYVGEALTITVQPLLEVTGVSPQPTRVSFTAEVAPQVYVLKGTAEISATRQDNPQATPSKISAIR